MSEEQPNRWGPLAPFGEAIRFLTILPVPGLPPMSETSIVRAIPFFPLVGLVIGALLWVVGTLASQFWPMLVCAALLVIVWGVLTAGLHLDGVADTFDAVMSWRPRDRKFEIMKDSRIGTMGALGLIAVVLLKVVFLDASGALWWQALLLAPLLGRWADIYGIFWFPAAREGGLGRSFQSQVRRTDFIVATLLTLVPLLLIGGVRGAIAMLCVWAATHILATLWVRDLGGLTGDIYGALCELAEVVALAAFAASV